MTLNCIHTQFYIQTFMFYLLQNVLTLVVLFVLMNRETSSQSITAILNVFTNLCY